MHIKRKKVAPGLTLPKTSKERPRRPLQLWERKYGMMIVDSPVSMSVADQELAASRLATEHARKDNKEAPEVKITYRQLKRLRARADFQEYVETVAKRGIEGARAIFATDMTTYAELHRWAADEAKKAGDYKAVPAITAPAIERFWPKKEDKPVNQAIVINMTPGQWKSFKEPNDGYLGAEELPVEDAEIVEDEGPTPELPASLTQRDEPTPRNESGEIEVPIQPLLGKRLNITPDMRHD